MSLFSFLTEEKSINIKFTNQITRMETLAHKQTTTHSSSHGEDEACEGGWSGYPSDHTIRYDTIGEFNVDWKAEYSALSSTRSQKKKLKQPTPVPL